MTFRPDLMGRAALTRIENLDGPPFDWQATSATMADFAKRLTKAELAQVCAYLAARVVAADQSREGS